jgi:hypothetical protein
MLSGPRTWRTGTVLLVALAVAALTAAVAGAALYSSSRPALEMDITAKRHRITGIEFQIKLHCDNGRVVFFGSGIKGPIRVNHRTGRFQARDDQGSGESSNRTRVNGTVHRRLLTGHIRVRVTTPAPWGPTRCRSGRADDLWVRFVARRQ